MLEIAWRFIDQHPGQSVFLAIVLLAGIYSQARLLWDVRFIRRNMKVFVTQDQLEIRMDKQMEMAREIFITRRECDREHGDRREGPKDRRGK